MVGHDVQMTINRCCRAIPDNGFDRRDRRHCLGYRRDSESVTLFKTPFIATLTIGMTTATRVALTVWTHSPNERGVSKVTHPKNTEKLSDE